MMTMIENIQVNKEKVFVIEPIFEDKILNNEDYVLKLGWIAV